MRGHEAALPGLPRIAACGPMQADAVVASKNDRAGSMPAYLSTNLHDTVAHAPPNPTDSGKDANLIGMTLLLAILGTILGAAIGAAAGFFAIIALAALLGVSDPNGGVAMGAAATGLPIGAVIGAVAGFALVLRLRRNAVRASPRQAVTAGAVMIASVAAGLSWLNYVPPTPTLAHPIHVDLEFRVPTAQIALGPHQGQLNPQLLTMQAHIDPEELSITEDGEITSVTATHRLRFRTDEREIVMPIATARYVILDLPPVVMPEATDGFSDWRPADHVRQNYYAQDEPMGHGISYRIQIRNP